MGLKWRKGKRIQHMFKKEGKADKLKGRVKLESDRNSEGIELD